MVLQSHWPMRYEQNMVSRHHFESQLVRPRRDARKARIRRSFKGFSWNRGTRWRRPCLVTLCRADSCVLIKCAVGLFDALVPGMAVVSKRLVLAEELCSSGRARGGIPRWKAFEKQLAWGINGKRRARGVGHYTPFFLMKREDRSMPQTLQLSRFRPCLLISSYTLRVLSPLSAQ